MKSTTCSASLSAYKAFFYAFLAGFSFSINAVLVRFARNTPAIQMSMYRFTGMLFVNLPIAVHERFSLTGPKRSRKMLFYRAVAAVLTVIFSFLSFRYLPVGEASVIVYSTPVFGTILAKLILKEVCGLVQSFIVGLTTLGIILIINPSTLSSEKDLKATEHTIGVVFGLAGMLCNCFTVILTRHTRNVHYSVVCFTSATVGTILCLLLIGSAYDVVFPECGVMRWVAVAMGASSSLGQIFYVRALQTENVGPIATLKGATDIVCAIAWQIGIFHESLDNFGVSGTLLVVVSIILIGLRKWVLMLPEDSPKKRKLKLFIS